MSAEEEEEHASTGSLDSSSQDALSESAETSFRLPSLSLSTQLVSNLERRGLTAPTEVQLQVIPKIRDERGRDLSVNAPTGSGKTLAYALPIVEASAS
jgi:superfamily II DNA/RNA helicase